MSFSHSIDIFEILFVTEHCEQNRQDPCCCEACITEERQYALVGDRIGSGN